MTGVWQTVGRHEAPSHELLLNSGLPTTRSVLRTGQARQFPEEHLTPNPLSLCAGDGESRGPALRQRATVLEDGLADARDVHARRPLDGDRVAGLQCGQDRLMLPERLVSAAGHQD